MLLSLEALESRAARTGLAGIPTKVRAGERLSPDEALAMYHTRDVTLLGALANEVRNARHGDTTYYNVNIHINYTNWCNKFCDFCAFQRRPGEDGAYRMSPEQIEEELRKANPEATEVHMVAGVWPALGYDYYLDILRAAKRARPDIHVKAFTMVEIDQIVRTGKQVYGKSIEEVMADLREAGLDSMPGGGAEVFSERLRQEQYPKKMGHERWLELAEQVHSLGFRTNATMLYGMGEILEERVEHLRLLRELQDRTGGFQAYIPLAFHPENTRLDHLPYPPPLERLRAVAIGRLFLDNFDHVKSYWIMMGLPVTQMSINFGANDIDGTVTQEKIYHNAGASTPQQLTRPYLLQLIREAGRQPVERDTLYQAIRRHHDDDVALRDVSKLSV